MITASPALYTGLQWLGAGYLIWLGVNGLLAKPAASVNGEQTTTRGDAAFSGFLVVFLNPKIAVFLIALFSQVIGTDTTMTEKLIYAATAMVIDMAWYISVAWSVSIPSWLSRLQRHSVWIERVFAVILTALALRLLMGDILN